MKNKEIEDLKKSKVFHQYSIKFHSFLNWKQYMKKKKLTQERGVLLENKTNRNKMREILSKFQEKGGKYCIK